MQISRAGGSVPLPARCLLVAAMNPCPCGNHGDPRRDCRCPEARLAAYRNRISGPLADRFDLRVAVPRADAHGEPGEPTEQVAARVAAAHALLARCEQAADAGADAAGSATDRLLLSARGRARTARVAATIAALDGRTAVTADDVAEALSLRIELTR